ncbi:MAG: hypothetical protein ACRELB_01120 [Polyangiaceae bacterium]
MRSLILASVAGAVAAGLSLLGACSQSSHGSHGVAPDADAGPQGDDGGEFESAVEAGDELTVGSECGAPPYVTLGIVVVALSLDNPDGSPLPGAEFTSPLCPSLVQYSDEAGAIQGEVSQDVPFYGRLQAPNYIRELSPEEVFDASRSGIKIDMLPSIFAAVLLPGFDASAQSAVVVAAQKTAADAGACSSLDGMTFTVQNHPEAQVIYYSNDTVPVVMPEAGATSLRGLAVILGLAPDQLVSLVGTKPGCNVAFQWDTLTGRTPVETGYVSLMPAYLTP